jgi:hypothetical protein
MDIYVALNDQPAPGGKSSVVGAFITKDKARAACEEVNEAPLTWENGEAAGNVGSYCVVLVDLDAPV